MELNKRGRGRPPKTIDFRTMLAESIPSADIFDEGEKKIYENLVGIYLKDFDEDQLTAADFDDIMSISMNRVLEFRLLKSSKAVPSMNIDASTAIERLRKQTDKLKENLGSRRKDRIDPKKFSGFSIVDLIAAYDKNRKNVLSDRTMMWEKEEDEILNSEALIGNRDDIDARSFDKDD